MEFKRTTPLEVAEDMGEYQVPADLTLPFDVPINSIDHISSNGLEDSTNGNGYVSDHDMYDTSGTLRAEDVSLPEHGEHHLPEPISTKREPKDLHELEEKLKRYFEDDREKTVVSVQRIVGDRGIAEQVVQEAHLAMWIHRDSFVEDRGGLGPWGAKIARNKAFDELRKQRSRTKHAGFGDQDLGTLVSGERTEEYTLRDETSNEILRVIGTLPDDYRRIVELRYFGDLSYSDIARELDVPMSTVRMRLHRAKHLFRGSKSVQSIVDSSRN